MGYGNTIGILYQFRPYAGKNTILQVYPDVFLGQDASVVAHLVNTLPNVGDSNYHIVMNSFFPDLLRHFSLNQIANTGTVRASPMKHVLLKKLGKIESSNIGCCNSCFFKIASSNTGCCNWCFFKHNRYFMERWQHSIYIHWIGTNSVCKTIFQEEEEQANWYWASQHYKYIQQINTGSWTHGPEYWSIHDQLTTKRVMVSPV